MVLHNENLAADELVVEPNDNEIVGGDAVNGLVFDELSYNSILLK